MKNKPTTVEARQVAIDQAIANTRIEGHEPTPEFTADAAAFVAGKLTPEQMIARALERAKAIEAGTEQAAPEVGGRVNFR